MVIVLEGKSDLVEAAEAENDALGVAGREDENGVREGGLVLLEVLEHPELPRRLTLLVPQPNLQVSGEKAPVDVGAAVKGGFKFKFARRKRQS